MTVIRTGEFFEHTASDGAKAGGLQHYLIE